MSFERNQPHRYKHEFFFYYSPLYPHNTTVFYAPHGTYEKLSKLNALDIKGPYKTAIDAKEEAISLVREHLQILKGVSGRLDGPTQNWEAVNENDYQFLKGVKL